MRSSRLGRLHLNRDKTGREPVHRVTSARRAVGEDVERRTRRYLVSMGVRTACFVLAVVTDGWLRWTMIAAAVLLPYLSVVFANGGRERAQHLPEAPVLGDRKAIGGSPL